MEPCTANGYMQEHVLLLSNCLERWTGVGLECRLSDRISAARQVYHADYALVSHNTDADPVFNYANLAAQTLFRMSWSKFVTTPSRFSAEPVHRSERSLLLAEVNSNGVIRNYRGIRITADGRRFEIRDALVWNLVDYRDTFLGQAAMFDQWEFVDDPRS